MQAIRSAANTGRTVICTIHQPSSTIFESFDSLLLLKRGGRTIFFGDLGPESSYLINHLESIPGAPKIKDGANPAVYMLEVIGGGSTGATSLKIDPAEQWLRCDLRLTMMAEITREHMDTEGKHKFEVDTTPRTVLEILTLTDRSFKMHWRTPEYNVTRVLTAAVFALIFGSVFWNHDMTDYSTAVERMALIYLAVLFQGFLCFTTVLPVMGAERPVFYRERATGMYSVNSYNLVLGLTEIPYLLVMCLAFTIVLYFTVGLRASEGAFFYFFLYTFLWMTFCTYFGHLMTAVAPNLIIAQGGGFGIINLLTVFAGFMKPAGDLGILEFIYWVSSMHYCFEGILVTQFRHDSSEIEFFEASVGQTVTLDVYDFMSDVFSDGAFKYGHRVYCIFAMIALCISNRALTHLALKHINHKSQ